MSTLEKLSELESRKTNIVESQNEEAKKAALAKGKLTARDRITALLDDNSFVELGAFVTSRSTAFNMSTSETPADGVVTGYGTVNGNPVYVYSQDASVLGGALGEMHAKKIVSVYDEAIKVGVPVVGFLDSVGTRLQEGMDALEGYGMIYAKMAEASGVIPQIAVVAGDCAGGAAFIPGLSDFVFMSTKSARMFLNSPNTLAEKTASFDTIATAKVHFEESGLASFIAENEEELIGKVSALISFLPLNSGEEAPVYEVQDDLNRVDTALNAFDVENGKVIDVVTSIVDNNDILEVNAGYGKSVVTAFGRMGGATVGIVANNESSVAGCGVKKMTAFVELCDTFNIPVVTLTNIEGFASSEASEKRGIIKSCSMLTKAFAESSVPKVNVIIGKAFGSSSIVMNSKALGCDRVYAWPTASFGSINAESAMKIIYSDELAAGTMSNEAYQEAVSEYEAMHTSAYAAAARGLVDDIIEPAATRKRVIAALEILATKAR